MTDEKRVSLVRPPEKQKRDEGTVEMLGKYGNFDLYEFEDKYYATNVQHELVEVRDLIRENKLISSDDADVLRDIIDSNNKWADTRGMYALDQEDASAAIRVNSFNLEEDDEESFSDPEIYHSRGEYFIIDGASKDKIEQEDLRMVVSYSVAAVPELVTDYQGYNIVEFDKTYFGISQSVGSVDLTKVSPGQLDGVFYADMIKGVMELIDAQVKIVGILDVPTLLKEVEAFNIVGYQKLIYGIPHALGSFDITTLTSEDLERHVDIIVGDTREEVETQIEEVSKTLFYYSQPKLLKEVGTFNIVGYQKVIYGIPHALGSFDITTLTSEDLERQADIICGSSVEEVDSLLFQSTPGQNKSLVPSVPIQEFIETTSDFNIFSYEDIYFAIPVSFGEYDLGEQDYFSEPQIVYDASLFGLREAIAGNGEITSQADKKEVVVPNFEQPMLLKEFEQFNIVGYQNMIYGIPHSLGEFDFSAHTSADLERHVGIVSGTSIKEIETCLHDLISDMTNENAVTG